MTTRMLSKHMPEWFSRGAGMADALRADAMSTAHACRVLGISAASSRRWHQRYGLM